MAVRFFMAGVRERNQDNAILPIAGGPRFFEVPFTYTVVGEMGYSWQIALGAVFISGVLFVFMSLSRIREWLLNSIPMSLRFAMGAGSACFSG